MLDSKIVAAITRQIHQRFPEVAGSQPKVRTQETPENQPGPVYLLTFRGTGELPGGKTIPRAVRVVVNHEGKIIKITTSR